MAKFHGDVRPLSHDPRYMDGGFSGDLDDAIAQAKAAPDHGVPPLIGRAYVVWRDYGLSRDRIALLQHLNLVAQ